MQINVNYLKAAAVAVGKEETRYYLKGVAIQANQKGVFIVATDGHRLAAFRQAPELENLTECSIIIPIETINALKTREETVELGKINGAQYMLGNLIFEPIDGTFPEWRRIIPKETSGEIAQFNAAYMADWAKMTKALGKKDAKIIISHNGDSPALVHFGLPDIDGFGVIMPFRAHNVPTGAPAWAL